MKTIKIKVEIEAEVPEGEYCWDFLENIRCEKMTTMSHCDLFGTVEKDIRSLRIAKILKCPQCLEACKEVSDE